MIRSYQKGENVKEIKYFLYVVLFDIIFILRVAQKECILLCQFKTTCWSFRIPFCHVTPKSTPPKPTPIWCPIRRKITSMNTWAWLVKRTTLTAWSRALYIKCSASLYCTSDIVNNNLWFGSSCFTLSLSTTILVPKPGNWKRQERNQDGNGGLETKPAPFNRWGPLSLILALPPLILNPLFNCREYRSQEPEQLYFMCFVY